jgi:outer membrane protein insertion porin family
MGRALAFRGALALLLGLGAAQAALAQDPPRVADIRFEGDLAPFSRTDLGELVRTRPNRRFLGLPGVTPSRWVYELGTERTALGRALQRAGEPPALLDTGTLEADRERLALLYRQEGFLSAEAATRVDTLAGRRVRVTFVLTPGPPSVLRRVRYEGLAQVSPEGRRRIARGSVLRLTLPEDPAPLDFAARPDQRLAETELLAERRRLLDDLRDRGFAAVTRDSIRAVAFPVDTLADGRPVFDVAFEVQTGPRYAFGDVRFVVTGPEPAPTRHDTFRVATGLVTTRIENERHLRPGLLRRALQFAPGERYRLSALLATKRRLDRAGAFSFSEVTPLPADGTVLPGDSLPRLPHRIALRARPRHAVRLEGFVLQRTPVLAGEAAGLGEEEIGLGAGVGYRNANAFGGGEQVTVGFNASVAGDFVEFPTAQAEASVALDLPYLAWPLAPLERALRPFDARTRLSLGFLTARRDELRLLVRGRATAGLRFEVQHTPSLTSFLDALDFRLSDPDTLGGFRQQFLDLIADPVARAFVLEDYTQPQINNALRYTLRSTTADLLRRDRGHARESSVEAGGNLPYLLDRYVFTPETVEGSLPGLPIFGGGSRLEYRPYLRATADAREYVALDRLTVLAGKALLGVAHPTGETPVVPFDRRFYAGGGGSVRGFELRRLGPGRIPPEASAFVQGGEVKLEATVELRRTVLRELFGADWQVAAFADAGNVWFGPRNPGDEDGRFRLRTFPEEIAIGAGGGVRVAWNFLILRLDAGWPVRSPIPGEPLFPEGNRPRLHFGIGQAL